MKICEHETWTDESVEFPEEYNWSIATSVQVEKVAHKICRRICEDLATEERTLAPGLREALRMMAKMTDANEEGMVWK